MTRSRLSSAAVAVMIGLAVVTSAASSDAQQPSPNITVKLEPSSRPELADMLAARLTAPDGQPINEEQIEFWIRADLLGERYALIGESPTDSSGVARLPFVPHRANYDVRVTFEGDERWGSAEVLVPIEFSPTRVVGYQTPDPTQLGSLRFVMPRLMGIVLGLIWVALLGLAFYTVRSIKRLGSPDGFVQD